MTFIPLLDKKKNGNVCITLKKLVYWLRRCTFTHTHTHHFVAFIIWFVAVLWFLPVFLSFQCNRPIARFYSIHINVTYTQNMSIISCMYIIMYPIIVSRMKKIDYSISVIKMFMFFFLWLLIVYVWFLFNYSKRWSITCSWG